MDKKIAGLIKRVSLVLAITLIIAFLMMMVGNKIRANMIKENQESQAYQEWLVENCKCLEKNKIECSEGYILQNQTCVNEQENTFTNILLKCSKYDCAGEIKYWNNETYKWS